MVDPLYIVRQWLLADSAVTDLLGTQTGQVATSGGIYAGDLPENFDPTLGPGIQINADGGEGDPEILPLIDARITVRVWARPNDNANAHQVYRSCYDLMHGANMVSFGDSGMIISSLAASLPQDGSDPDTGWATVTGFFSIKFVETSAPIYTPVS